MTAEIALLNRRALVFAADSAVTISDGKRTKIYNTAEKIFELSRQVPIGIMLYNSMEFVEVPLDVLIRKFRAERDREFQTCKEACQEFLAYLAEFKRYASNEDRHLYNAPNDRLLKLSKKLKDEFPAAFIKEAEQQKEKADFSMVQLRLVTQILKEETARLLKRPLPGFMKSVTVKDFSERYDEMLQYLLKKHLAYFENSKDVLSLLSKWALAAVRSDEFSDALTGLVFGGFGTSDLFPSAYAVELDGVFFNEIKHRVTQDIDIDRMGDRAKILTFAQREMAERFLFGVDSETEAFILKYIKGSVDTVIEAIKKQNPTFDPASVNFSSKLYSDGFATFLDELKSKSQDETLDMVDLMPKQELAYTAEAFVNLTSIKRKVSIQQETVGGPVDVAVITRNEGFVWIKRKHYFEVELNPGYAVRAFGNIKMEREDVPAKRPDRRPSPGKKAGEAKRPG